MPHQFEKAERVEDGVDAADFVVEDRIWFNVVCPLPDRYYVPRMSVEEIESAISRLSATELSRFTKWFEEFAAEEWDRQIEADIRAGRLDAAGKRADEQFEAGNCTPL